MKGNGKGSDFLTVKSDRGKTNKGINNYLQE